ncbi:L,D-transpeptidase [Phenylobacterium sp.]|uniref:L,D-transpeptidase family protein n=1 Tax=Phenylobacterium sp. TaxID=1871053 RepID=UPI0035B1405F
MIFTALSDGRFLLGERTTRCALGKNGVVEAAEKREGDGRSPLGTWTIRRVLYRPDKGGPPQTRLPAKALERDDGWCDDPLDPAYNRAVKLPHPASAEQMWRQDDLYDLVCVLAHNDDPPVPGRGSAIFMHLARPDGGPTEGCVALSREDLLDLLAQAQIGDAVAIERA